MIHVSKRVLRTYISFLCAESVFDVGNEFFDPSCIVEIENIIGECGGHHFWRMLIHVS